MSPASRRDSSEGPCRCLRRVPSRNATELDEAAAPALSILRECMVDVWGRASTLCLGEVSSPAS
eukprot:3725364-Amphidinium_carterae.1